MHREFRRLFWPCRRPCSVAQSVVDNEQAEVVIDGVATTNNLHDALVAGSVEGAVVTLLKDVDLAGKNWEPIAVFHGTFDGDGYTISNLSIEQEADFAGFIAKASGNNNDLSKKAVVKNVTFDTVTVMAPAQSYVAAVVAECAANVMISNVDVTGTIKIDGKKYVAAIAGHGYVAKIVDCTVDGFDNAESFIKGSDAASNQIGGIMGMTSEGENPIFNCSVKNVTISGNRIVGGIAGRCKEGNQIVGCSVENVILKSDAPTLGAMIGQRLEEGSSVNKLLNYTQQDTVLQGSDGTAKEFAWYGDKSGNINYIYSQNAVGNSLVAGASNYALTAGDYTLEGEGALAALTAQCAAGYAPVDNEDGTYTIQMADYAIEYAWVGVAEDDVAKIDNSKNPTSYTIATETIMFAEPTLEGYTFKGWDTPSIEKGSTGAKTITGTFEKEQGGIVPGGDPVPVSGETEAEALEEAAKLPIMLTPAQEAAGLTTADFCNKVRPAAAGGFEAYVEVAAVNAPVIETESTDVKPIEVGATDFSATIKNAKPGLYYGFKAVDALGDTFEPVGEAATATAAGDLTITAPKGEGNARFYKLTVSITDIWDK